MALNLQSGNIEQCLLLIPQMMDIVSIRKLYPNYIDSLLPEGHNITIRSQLVLQYQYLFE